MTTYEQIKQEERNAGKIEGNLEQQNLVITNSFREGLEIHFIARITGLSKREVEERIKELGLDKEVK